MYASRLPAVMRLFTPSNHEAEERARATEVVGIRTAVGAARDGDATVFESSSSGGDGGGGDSGSVGRDGKDGSEGVGEGSKGERDARSRDKGGSTSLDNGRQLGARWPISSSDGCGFTGRLIWRQTFDSNRKAKDNTLWTSRYNAYAACTAIAR